MTESGRGNPKNFRRANSTPLSNFLDPPLNTIIWREPGTETIFSCCYSPSHTRTGLNQNRLYAVGLMLHVSSPVHDVSQVVCSAVQHLLALLSETGEVCIQDGRAYPTLACTHSRLLSCKRYKGCMQPEGSVTKEISYTVGRNPN